MSKTKRKKEQSDNDKMEMKRKKPPRRKKNKDKLNNLLRNIRNFEDIDEDDIMSVDDDI